MYECCTKIVTVTFITMFTLFYVIRNFYHFTLLIVSDAHDIRLINKYVEF